MEPSLSHSQSAGLLDRACWHAGRKLAAHLRAMASLREQVVHIQTFVETAGTVSGAAAVQEAQCESLVAMLRSAKDLTRETANDLVLLVGQGPWTSAQKSTLVTALSEASMRSPEDSQKRWPSQQVRSFGRFFSKRDREVLASDASQVGKLDQLAERCYRIGCVLPSESSYRTILSAAAAAGLQVDVQRSLQLTTDFKDILKRKVSKRPRPHPHLEIFPTDPAALPQEVYQAAYADDPVDGIEDAVATVAGPDIDLRKTRRKSTQLVPAPQAPSSSSTAMPALSAEQWQQQMAMMASVAGMFMNQKKAEATPDIHMLKPKTPALAAEPAARPGDSQALQPLAPPPDAQPLPPPPNTQQQQVIAAPPAEPEPTKEETPAGQVARVQKALEDKRGTATEAKKQAAKPKQTCMKRPAASAKPAVHKRPASNDDCEFSAVQRWLGCGDASARGR